jgi:integrase
MVKELRGVIGVRDAAILLVGFAGAFRRSEIVNLEFGDLAFVQQGVVIHLRYSKTDQEGKGRKVAIPYAKGSVCAVRALQRWLRVSSVKEGKVFRAVNRHGSISRTGLRANVVGRIVKKRVAQIGLDPSQYAGHSLRAGLVTSAAKAGVSSWKIRQQTGHKSDAMLNRYIRDDQIFLGNAAASVL